MQSAQQSGKLVNTLFPEEVRDQLYQEQQEQAKLKQQKETWVNVAGSSPEQQGPTDSAAEFATGGVSDHKKAIASLYPETTIFFADLVGFTGAFQLSILSNSLLLEYNTNRIANVAWSGKRTPVEVFQLLEALCEFFLKQPTGWS